MTTAAQDASSSLAEDRGFAWLSSAWFRRLMIVVVGCVVMAALGSGLAGYLDTTAATGADIPTFDTSPQD